MTDSQQKIADVCDEMKNVLLYKNEKDWFCYGRIRL